MDPNVEKTGWYHYRLTDGDTENLLRQNGDFLLRTMADDRNEWYEIAVRWDDHICHFTIQKTTAGYSFQSHWRPNVSSLIDFHMQTGTPLTTTHSDVRLEHPVDREAWELLTNQLEEGEFLGGGSFGNVFHATLTRTSSTTAENVALKRRKRGLYDSDNPCPARIEMTDEARAMRAVGGHPNILELRGVTIDSEEPFLITEYASGGSLKANISHLSETDKRRLCMEAALGLAHIHSKGYVHRDLAARNCMLTAPDAGQKVGHVKIGDYGLSSKLDSEGQYIMPSRTTMPLFWTAPESLETLRFTTASDVWSLGVLIWEVFSNGLKPYKDWSKEKNQYPKIVDELKAGNRLKTDDFPDDVRDILTKCWSLSQNARPSAKEVAEKMGNRSGE